MLDYFTPEEFDERVAAARLEEEGPQWVERLATILKLGFAAMALGKVDPEHFDPMQPQKLESMLRRPADSRTHAPLAEPGPSEAVSPNQAAALFATFAGPPQRG
ncbi:MAG TPA: hypothetical protein VMY37_25725 [Thermoguttaceae bacterium]|nr:hypothetical protein [Thermoguttaceae bacterium]